jgi:hypothetical protein
VAISWVWVRIALAVVILAALAMISWLGPAPRASTPTSIDTVVTPGRIADNEDDEASAPVSTPVRDGLWMIGPSAPKPTEWGHRIF